MKLNRWSKFGERKTKSKFNSMLFKKQYQATKNIFKYNVTQPK